MPCFSHSRHSKPCAVQGTYPSRPVWRLPPSRETATEQSILTAIYKSTCSKGRKRNKKTSDSDALICIEKHRTRLPRGKTGRITRQALNRRTNARRFFRAVHPIFWFCFSPSHSPCNGTSLAVSHWKLRMVLMVEYRSSRLNQNKPFS